MKLRLITAALAALLVTVPAHAAKMLLTFSGVVTNVQGALPLGVASGAGYVASFVINTDAPVLSSVASPTHSYINSGTGYGLPANNLAILGQITINGTTIGQLGRYTGNVQYTDQINDPTYGDQHVVYATGQRAGGDQLTLVLGFNDIDFLPSAYLTTEFSYAVPVNRQNDQSIFTTGSGGFFNMTVASVAAQRLSVPEPASWAMMITGFGMVGGSMRRRRSLTVARC